MLVIATVGLIVLGAAWFYSRLLLRPFHRPEYTERLDEVRDGSVRLRDSPWTAAPGEWGLLCASGPPDRPTGVGPASVVDAAVSRPLLDGPVPVVGPVTMDAGRFGPDPSAVGLAFDQVTIRGPVGDLPAWYVPATGSTWVIAVHGRGAPRRECLRMLPVPHRLGFPTLVVSYRNDIDAPSAPDRLYHLGDTEWRDLAAAVEHALAAGATDLVLYGWSMGAAVVAAFLDRAPGELTDPVRGTIWDSPVADWRATLRHQARLRHLPSGFGSLAGWVTSRRIGIDLDHFDLRNHPPARRPPTLLMHGTADTAVPVGISRALAGAAAELRWPLSYLEFPGAEHTALWNTDRPTYEAAVARFLAGGLAEPVPGP